MVALSRQVAPPALPCFPISINCVPRPRHAQAEADEAAAQRAAADARAAELERQLQAERERLAGVRVRRGLFVLLVHALRLACLGALLERCSWPAAYIKHAALLRYLQRCGQGNAAAGPAFIAAFPPTASHSAPPSQERADGSAMQQTEAEARLREAERQLEAERRRLQELQAGAFAWPALLG